MTLIEKFISRRISRDRRHYEKWATSTLDSIPLLVNPMIPPISWMDMLFFGIFLVPNLLLQLSVREFLILVCLALPYCTSICIGSKPQLFSFFVSKFRVTVCALFFWEFKCKCWTSVLFRGPSTSIRSFSYSWKSIPLEDKGICSRKDIINGRLHLGSLKATGFVIQHNELFQKRWCFIYTAEGSSWVQQYNA